MGGKAVGGESCKDGAKEGAKEGGKEGGKDGGNDCNGKDSRTEKGPLASIDRILTERSRGMGLGKAPLAIDTHAAVRVDV